MSLERNGNLGAEMGVFDEGDYFKGSKLTGILFWADANKIFPAHSSLFP